MQCRRPWFNSSARKIRWKRDRLSTPVFLGFSGGSAVKESACNVGDPWVGKIPWRREQLPTPVSCLENSMDYTVSLWSHKESNKTDNPLQYSSLENPMDKRNLAGSSPQGHKSWTWFSDWTITIILFYTKKKKHTFNFSFYTSANLHFYRFNLSYKQQLKQTSIYTCCNFKVKIITGFNTMDLSLKTSVFQVLLIFSFVIKQNTPQWHVLCLLISWGKLADKCIILS